MACNRPEIVPDIAREVLIRSRRRCCLCFGVDGNFNEQIGQIVHVDKDPTHNTLDNLAWLCLEHHSLYDSSTSQHKNYQPNEIKQYRDKLYSTIATSSVFGPESLGEYVATERTCTVIHLLDRIIVIFDWPMRCSPTLYLFPPWLIQNNYGCIDQWTSRGFQVVFKRPLSLPTFAFFADASPKENKKEAERKCNEWKESVGYDTPPPAPSMV